MRSPSEAKTLRILTGMDLICPSVPPSSARRYRHLSPCVGKACGDGDGADSPELGVEGTLPRRDVEDAVPYGGKDLIRSVCRRAVLGATGTFPRAWGRLVGTEMVRIRRSLAWRGRCRAGTSRTPSPTEERTSSAPVCRRAVLGATGTFPRARGRLVGTEMVRIRRSWAMDAGRRAGTSRTPSPTGETHPSQN